MHGSILKQLNNGKPRRAFGPARASQQAKPDVCVISDGEAGAYCTVGLVSYKPLQVPVATCSLNSISNWMKVKSFALSEKLCCVVAML